MKKRIAVIGGGVSGLTCANLLRDKGHETIVFESDSRPGGMIKCDRVNGHLFHRTGGHVFNTKRKDVSEWFWKHFNKTEEFTLAQRNASVSMNKIYVPYPIENHIYLLGDNIVDQCIDEWLKNYKSTTAEKFDDFESFLLYRFGKTLYDLYFRPYNEKVWRRNLSNVPLSWLEGKLPMPTIKEMIFNNIMKVEEKKFVHSTFFYEKNDGSQYLADKLASSLNIRYNTKIEHMTFENGKWKLRGDTFDIVIFCGNIKQIPELTNNILSSKEKSFIKGLESHGTTSVLCEIEENPYSWIYMPSKEFLSHRIICTGNFSSTNRGGGKMSATIEFTDYISKEDILENLIHIPLNPKYITHHYEKYTYPIQDHSTRKNISSIKEKLSQSQLYLCGRFAEWEYANMDVCMGYAIDLCKTIA